MELTTFLFQITIKGMIFPASTLQFFISSVLVGIFGWRFYTIYNKTKSLYAKYLSYLLILFSIHVIFPLVISLLMSMGVQEAKKWGIVTDTITSGLGFVGLAFGGMALFTYYIPRKSPIWGFLLVIIPGIFFTVLRFFHMQNPTINDVGIVDWKNHPQSILGFNLVNAVI